MAPGGWANALQLIFLKSKLPAYLERQAEGKLSKFWPGLNETWFHEFPEEAALKFPLPNSLGDAAPLSAEQMTALGAAQLQNWFRHQRVKVRKAGAVSTPHQSVNSIATVLFKKEKKRLRKHQAIEVFQLRKADEIKVELTEAGFDGIKNEYAAMEGVDEGDGGDAQAKRLKAFQTLRMQLRTAVVNRMFQSASEEERDACKLQAETEVRRRKEAEEAGEKEEQTPAQYQENIDQLSEVFERVHKEVSKKAGWSGFTVVGGPQPRLNGELSMKVICFGVSPAGNNFEDSHPDFPNAVVIPYQTWLRRCFPPAVRRARALETIAEDVESDHDGAEPSGSRGARRRRRQKSKKKATAQSLHAPTAPSALASTSTVEQPPPSSSSPVTHSGAAEPSPGLPPVVPHPLMGHVGTTQADVFGPFGLGPLAMGTDYGMYGLAYRPANPISHTPDYDPLSIVDTAPFDAGDLTPPGASADDSDPPSTPSWAQYFDPALANISNYTTPPRDRTRPNPRGEGDRLYSYNFPHLALPSTVDDDNDNELLSKAPSFAFSPARWPSENSVTHPGAALPSTGSSGATLYGRPLLFEAFKSSATLPLPASLQPAATEVLGASATTTPSLTTTTATIPPFTTDTTPTTTSTTDIPATTATTAHTARLSPYEKWKAAEALRQATATTVDTTTTVTTPLLTTATTTTTPPTTTAVIQRPPRPRPRLAGKEIVLAVLANGAAVSTVPTTTVSPTPPPAATSLAAPPPPPKPKRKAAAKQQQEPAEKRPSSKKSEAAAGTPVAVQNPAAVEDTAVDAGDSGRRPRKRKLDANGAEIELPVKRTRKELAEKKAGEEGAGQGEKAKAAGRAKAATTKKSAQIKSSAAAAKRKCASTRGQKSSKMALHQSPSLTHHVMMYQFTIYDCGKELLLSLIGPHTPIFLRDSAHYLPGSTIGTSD
ncbi:hypothetical protein C8J57DRAFT_1730615 [Mycena rebaudengoi]|nr:hypothetical protein C8J57DRAFT_1730615 [Mycena rebaudengoi]